MLGFPFLFLMPQQFCAYCKGLSHPPHTKGWEQGNSLSRGLTLGLELLPQISKAIVLSKRSKQEMEDRERKAQ